MGSLSHEECQKQLRRMCMVHRDTVYFYYNVEKDTWYVEPNEVLPEELQGQDVCLLTEILELQLVDFEDRFHYETFYHRIMQGMNEPIHMEEMSISVRMKTAQSPLETVRIVCFFKMDESGRIVELTGKFRPMTEQEKNNNAILEQFSCDKNPSLFFKQVATFMEGYQEQPFAYIQMDVNKFKLINDTYGTDVGDAVLVHINNILDLLCDDTQLHTRYASDQFVVVMPYTSKEDVVSFIQSIDGKISCYHDIRYKMTYGVSISDDRHLSARSYFDEAGIARMSIKGKVLENIAFYNSNLKSSMKSMDAIEQVEEDALANQEFVMYLQPKYDFSMESPMIIGAEALVRWQHPERGLIPPGDFIPLFEQNGFILKVDEYIWEYACMTLARWIAEGKTPVPISINISRTYLQKIDVVAYISSLVEKYQIPINLLQLEITETMENEETLAYISSFKRAGFTMLMDDFGSGYSSLNMLKNTRFDVLKIDRGFLSEFLESNRGKAIVAHIISMSDELGLDTIAEGVETREQAEFLHEKGCTVAQGFYFSKPLPLEEFERIAFPDDYKQEEVG